MCRNIKRLRDGKQRASNEEIEEAALQFVRKVSGFRKPSRANAEAFEIAVKEVSAASLRLLEAITLEHLGTGAGSR